MATAITLSFSTASLKMDGTLICIIFMPNTLAAASTLNNQILSWPNSTTESGFCFSLRLRLDGQARNLYHLSGVQIELTQIRVRADCTH